MAKKTFQIAMAVPIHDRHGPALGDAQPCQGAAEPPDTLAKTPVAEANLVPVDDFLLGILL